ncbi:DUF1657 domain-containing protein [Fictibacillus enclensis]
MFALQTESKDAQRVYNKNADRITHIINKFNPMLHV